MFVRDMPRLSVDIDLTYLPIEPRGLSFVAGYGQDMMLGNLCNQLEASFKNMS